MSKLPFCENIDEVRQRLTVWWNGVDMVRPAIQIIAPRAKPIETIPAIPQPEGWVTDYSNKDFDYRLNLGARACIHNYYLGEVVPSVSPDLAPNCLALYLGCRGIEMPGTVLQWTLGTGNEPTDRPRWWSYYHKTIEAGKKILIGCSSIENLKCLKKEFGPKLKSFLINMCAESPEQAEEILDIVTI